MTDWSDTNTMCPACAGTGGREELVREGLVRGGVELGELDDVQDVKAALAATTATAIMQRRRVRRAKSFTLPSRFIADHLTRERGYRPS